MVLQSALIKSSAVVCIFYYPANTYACVLTEYTVPYFRTVRNKIMVIFMFEKNLLLSNFIIYPSNWDKPDFMLAMWLPTIFLRTTPE